PLLLAGYEGMKAREKTIPKESPRLTEALERLVQLYDAWGKRTRPTNGENDSRSVLAQRLHEPRGRSPAPVSRALRQGHPRAHLLAEEEIRKFRGTLRT